MYGQCTLTNLWVKKCKLAKLISKNATRPKFVISKNNKLVQWYGCWVYGQYLFTNRHECEINLTLKNNFYKKYTLENIDSVPKNIHNYL